MICRSVCPITLRRYRGRWSALGILLLAISPVAHALECSTTICVGNPCTISGIHQLSDNCDLNFGSKTVTVAGRLQTGTFGGGFSIEAGNLRVTGSLVAQNGVIAVRVDGYFRTDGSGTINVNQGGVLDVDAGGDVVLDGSEINADGLANDFAGDILITGNDITVATTNQIHANGASGGDGGSIALFANGNANIGGIIKANGVGADAAAGEIFIAAGWKGNLTVSRTLEAITSNNGYVDGIIALGPACAVVISGTLRTRNANLNHPGYGVNLIDYGTSLNASGASILADDSDGTEIDCRCVDTNGDRVCDGACVQAPVGLGSGVNPPAVVVPTAIPPCGCGDGIVDALLGEQCDDGNGYNGDGCRYDCRLPP